MKGGSQSPTVIMPMYIIILQFCRLIIQLSFLANVPPIPLRISSCRTANDALSQIHLLANDRTSCWQNFRQFDRFYQKMSYAVPCHAQKRVLDRMSRTLGVDSKVSYGSCQGERSKFSVLRKILNISSIKPEVKKVLLKSIENGLDGQGVEQVLAYSKSILDNDRQKQLGEQLALLSQERNESQSILFKIVRQLVVSPLEKSYISKIEKELREDEQLEVEISEAEARLAEEKAQRLREYEGQKSGLVSRVKGRNELQESQNFQNKLLRANQKLNELSSQNDKLRERINQLRKEKNAMEDIYCKLKHELQGKKENVEHTIKFAGDAYCSRNKAEQDLRTLKEQSELRKEQFRTECEKLNAEIQHDLRFKQFIRSKEVEREQLERLEREVEQNESNIELKKEENFRIDQEYKKSLEKEQEIRRCFERLKKEVGCSDAADSKDLLSAFLSLYQKNLIMKDFVNEITTEVKELEERIECKKAQIQKMYLKGSADDYDRDKLDQDLKSKFDHHQKKRKILDAQLDKSTATLMTVKKYLEDIFEEIGVDPELTEKLRGCTLNEENLAEFLGELEKKGLEAISHYGKLVSEQLKAEKGAGWEIQRQIDQLNNIITLENANAMNGSAGLRSSDYPSELLIKVKEERLKEQQLDKPLTAQDFKRFAIESLQTYQKRQLPKQKHLNKKYNIAPMISKSKKK